MSRKDFQLIASTIALLDIDATTRRTIADAFAYRLAGHHHRFDSKRFVAACMPSNTTEWLAKLCRANQ